MLRDDTRLQRAQDLALRMRQLETSSGKTAGGDLKVTSTGIPALDKLMPSGGIRSGTLIEWLSPATGSGAGTLSILVAAELMRTSGQLVVMDPQRQWYGPALEGMGVDLTRTLFVRPQTRQKVLWATEQALRCAAVKAVVCAFDSLEDKAYRRLQLAAEAGETIGLFLRHQRFYKQPSWAELRLGVKPYVGVKPRIHGAASTAGSAILPGRSWQVHLLYARGHFRAGSVKLQLDEQTGKVSEISDVSRIPGRQASDRAKRS